MGGLDGAHGGLLAENAATDLGLALAIRNGPATLGEVVGVADVPGAMYASPAGEVACGTPNISILPESGAGRHVEPA
eukprot:11207373-Lingulodinium_polyedra.AAC.1